MYSGEKVVHRPSLIERRKNRRPTMAGGGKKINQERQFIKPVDLFTSTGESFSGIVSSYTNSTMKIDRLQGSTKLPILKEGSTVNIKACLDLNKYMDLSGTVSKSTIFNLVLVNTRENYSEDKRLSVRQPMHGIPAEIYESIKDYLKTSVPCSLIDISLDGAKVTCNKEYQEGTELILRVELAKGLGPITFRCEVVRSDMQDGVFVYGLLFAKLDERKLKNLASDLEEVRYRELHK